jgi:hypothetical protein
VTPRKPRHHLHDCGVPPANMPTLDGLDAAVEVWLELVVAAAGGKGATPNQLAPCRRLGAEAASLGIRLAESVAFVRVCCKSAAQRVGVSAADTGLVDEVLAPDCHRQFTRLPDHNGVHRAIREATRAVVAAVGAGHRAWQRGEMFGRRSTEFELILDHLGDTFLACFIENRPQSEEERTRVRRYADGVRTSAPPGDDPDRILGALFETLKEKLTEFTDQQCLGKSGAFNASAFNLVCERLDRFEDEVLADLGLPPIEP